MDTCTWMLHTRSYIILCQRSTFYLFAAKQFESDEEDMDIQITMVKKVLKSIKSKINKRKSYEICNTSYLVGSCILTRKTWPSSKLMRHLQLRREGVFLQSNKAMRIVACQSEVRLISINLLLLLSVQ